MGTLNHTGEQLDEAIEMVLNGYADVSQVDAQESDVVQGKNFVKANGAVATGTLVAGITPVGNQDITTLAQYDVTSKATAQVPLEESMKFIPENIKNGVSLMGVTGNLVAGFDEIDVGLVTFGYNQCPQGTFADIQNPCTKLTGSLNGNPFEAILLKLGQYNDIFGIAEDGMTFIQFILNDQDDLTITYHSLS